MTAFVLDNSVAMRWCFDSNANAYADSVLRIIESGTGTAFVPVLWRYEVSAVLARAQKTGLLTSQSAEDFLDDLQTLPIVIDAESANRILTDVHRLAVTYRLTAYDAAYLELAKRLGLPIATLDADLARACAAAALTVV